MTEGPVAVPLQNVANSSQIQHLETVRIQQEHDLAALHSKYSEALNYLGMTHTHTQTQPHTHVHHQPNYQPTGECLETIDNLHEDINDMRAIVQQQSEMLAQYKMKDALDKKQLPCKKAQQHGVRQASCDSAFEWPLNDSCRVSEQGDTCACGMDEGEIETAAAHVEDHDHAVPTLEQQVTKLLVGADKAEGPFRHSCLFPWVF